MQSQQYKLLMSYYKAHQVQIAKGVIDVSCKVLGADRSKLLPYGWAGGKICMNDELWDALPKGSPEAISYEACVGMLGNAEDECRLLADIWVFCLAGTETRKFWPIIRNIAEINIHGL